MARITYWLEGEEGNIEVLNIINGTPSYGELLDSADKKTKKRPIASVSLKWACEGILRSAKKAR